MRDDPSRNLPRASEVFVGAGGLDRFVVGATFDDVVAIECQDEFGMADRVQAVIGHETGVASQRQGQRALNPLLSLRVDGTGRVW